MVDFYRFAAREQNLKSTKHYPDPAKFWVLMSDFGNSCDTES